jgi:hypothetical protein
VASFQLASLTTFHVCTPSWLDSAGSTMLSPLAFSKKVWSPNSSLNFGAADLTTIFNISSLDLRPAGQAHHLRGR